MWIKGISETREYQPIPVSMMQEYVGRQNIFSSGSRIFLPFFTSGDLIPAEDYCNMRNWEQEPPIGNPTTQIVRVPDSQLS